MSQSKKRIKAIFGTLCEKQKFASDTQTQYTEWGYQEPKDLKNAREYMIKNAGVHEGGAKDLKSGMLLTVFNTISKGKVEWSGTVNFEYKSNIQSGSMNSQYSRQQVFGMWIKGLQKDEDAKKWTSMFCAGMPATLERDGKVVHGSLELFYEEGTDGLIWSLTEFGKMGYAGMHYIKDGDNLTVYNKVTDGEVAWQSTLEFDEFSDNPKEVEMLPYYKSNVKRMPKGIQKEEWQAMFSNQSPIKIESARSLKKSKPLSRSSSR